MNTSPTREMRLAELPVACTLSGDKLEDRLATWRRLKTEFLIEQRHISGGVVLTYARASGVEETLRELARLEGECCAWADWKVDLAEDDVRLEVTTTGERVVALRSMFAQD